MNKISLTQFEKEMQKYSNETMLAQKDYMKKCLQRAIKFPQKK